MDGADVGPLIWGRRRLALRGSVHACHPHRRLPAASTQLRALVLRPGACRGGGGRGGVGWVRVEQGGRGW
eukprot:3493677-Rhodomonas_salina.1